MSGQEESLHVGALCDSRRREDLLDELVKAAAALLMVAARVASILYAGESDWAYLDKLVVKVAPDKALPGKLKGIGGECLMKQPSVPHSLTHSLTSLTHRLQLLVEVAELAVSVEDLVGLAVGRHNLNLVHLIQK